MTNREEQLERVLRALENARRAYEAGWGKQGRAWEIIALIRQREVEKPDA